MSEAEGAAVEGAAGVVPSVLDAVVAVGCDPSATSAEATRIALVLAGLVLESTVDGAGVAEQASSA